MPKRWTGDGYLVTGRGGRKVVEDTRTVVMARLRSPSQMATDRCWPLVVAEDPKQAACGVHARVLSQVIVDEIYVCAPQDQRIRHIWRTNYFGLGKAGILLELRAENGWVKETSSTPTYGRSF